MLKLSIPQTGVAGGRVGDFTGAAVVFATTGALVGLFVEDLTGLFVGALTGLAVS